MSSEVRFRATLAGLSALALGVRTYGLANPSMWFDEALEYARAAGPVSVALLGRPVDQDPPLLALLGHLWLQFGYDEFWLRVPSALLGAAAVFLVGAWAGRRLGRSIGLLTALLLALAPVQVHYSRELNQYSALVFLSIVAFLAWERVLSRGGRTDWAIYTAVSVVGLCTHYGFAFPVAAMGIYLANRCFRGGDRSQRRRMTAYLAVVALTVVALVMLSLPGQLATPHLQRRFGGTHVQKELDYFMDRFWREVLVFFLFPFSGGPVLWAVAALTLTAAAGAATLWRRDQATRRIVGVLFIGTLVLIYPADGFGLFPIGHRYVLFLSPPFYVALAVGFGVVWSRSRTLATLGVLTTLALFTFFLPLDIHVNQWLSVPREELRPVLEELDRRSTTDEMLYVYYGALPAYSYYRFGADDRALHGRHLDDAGAAAEAARIAANATERGTWLVVAHERSGDLELLLTELESLGLVVTDEIPGTNAGALRVSRNSDGRRE